jgi:uncharacterized lipoprotein YddW (UPF0748 family)
MRNHILLLLILCLIPGKMIQAQNKIQEVKGTFLVLAYQDERNKYMYPMGFDNTDPQMWKAKIRELHKMGIEYVIFQQIANDGKAFYPSKIMPRGYENSKPPSTLLCTSIWPPWIKTAFFTMESPSPVPPILRERPLSTR